MPDKSAVVLSVLCNVSGIVSSVLRDDLNVLSSCRPNCHLREIVDSAGTEKMWNFLAELTLKRAAADWSFNVPVGEKLETLYFAGAAVRDELAVVAALSREGMEAYFEELMQINNEHANALRTALKEQSLERRRDDMPTQLYHDMMQLNNELANTQRELAKKNAQLAQLNDEKNRFIGMAAHDLRTPLNVVFGYGELLRNEWDDIPDEERIEMIDRITDSGKHMLNLVDSLLSFANLEASSLHLDLQPLDVAELLMDAASQMVPLAERKQIGLSMDAPDELPKVRADASRIAQVLMNLLSNAIKYSPPKSTVHLSARDLDGRIELSVSDEGPGIPDEELRLLLHPGVAPRRPSGEPMHEGLGLLIASRIIRAHGSGLRAAATQPQGTTFSFELPVA